MSAIHHAHEMTGSPRARVATKERVLPKDLARRALFGALLALAAIFVTWAGGYVFAGFVAVAAIAAAREWHRMVGTPRYGREWSAAALAIAAAMLVAVAAPAPYWPPAVLAVGALVAGALGAGQGAPFLWSALGVLYIGVPAWSLVALRTQWSAGGWIVLGLFLVVWTADTGALFVGQALKGPKLVPALSPNKTWAGLAGGLLLPALMASGYAALLGGSALNGFVLGLVLAAVAHSGDLFESWIKRRVGRKNSGELIPGHGGVLDRLDSTLFAAPVAALLVLALGVGTLLGGHP